MKAGKCWYVSVPVLNLSAAHVQWPAYLLWQPRGFTNRPGIARWYQYAIYNNWMHKLHLSKRGWEGEGCNLVCALSSSVVMLYFICALFSLCLSPSLIKSCHLSHQLIKVRSVQSAVSGEQRPDTRHTSAGGWDIWDFRTLMNSKRGNLWACLCRCRWARRVRMTPSLWTRDGPEAPLGLPGLSAHLLEG